MNKDIDDDTQGYLSDRPKREWVGLTDAEIELIYGVIIKICKKDIMPVEQKQFAKTLELLLRKKNT
jgi:hypothetical protein